MAYFLSIRAHSKSREVKFYAVSDSNDQVVCDINQIDHPDKVRTYQFVDADGQERCVLTGRDGDAHVWMNGLIRGELNCKSTFWGSEYVFLMPGSGYWLIRRKVFSRQYVFTKNRRPVAKVTRGLFGSKRWRLMVDQQTDQLLVVSVCIGIDLGCRDRARSSSGV